MTILTITVKTIDDNFYYMCILFSVVNKLIINLRSYLHIYCIDLHFLKAMRLACGSKNVMELGVGMSIANENCFIFY